jgi:DNA-binding NarL/FixJ family response regulator
VIVEDHVIVREGLQLLLTSTGRFDVVGETPRGTELEALTRQTEPDAVLLDIGLADGSGIAVVESFKRRFQEIPVVVVTGQDDHRFYQQAVRAGVEGYVLKQDSAHGLVEALDSVLAGRRHFSESMQAVQQEEVPHGELTRRERQIIRLVAKGRTNHEIGEELCISTLTVRKHRQNLMLKLGLKNAVEISLFCIGHGLLDPANDV